MSINRIQKLLFSEYCDFEDMVLVESPFAQTTREGKGIRQIHLGLTPTKLVLATDVLPSAKESFVTYLPGIDPDIETFELVAVYPVDCINLSIFHHRKRQSLKAHFCNNRILYFELGGFEKRNMFWNLWCERVKFLSPEDPGSSHSETSVATSMTNSTLYLLASKKVTNEAGMPQLWCKFGTGDNQSIDCKWTDRYLFLGTNLDESPLNYTPTVLPPSITQFVYPKLKKNKFSLPSTITTTTSSELQHINRFGLGIREGCSTGLFLPAEDYIMPRRFSDISTQSADLFTLYPLKSPNEDVNYNELMENAVRLWEVAKATNPNLPRLGKHRRRYGLAPQPLFLHGLGPWNVPCGERYSIQVKRAVSAVNLTKQPMEPELRLPVSKRQLTASISCETLHLDNKLNVNLIQAAHKRPVIFFWTPDYWYRPRSAKDAYEELQAHLKKIKKYQQARDASQRKLFRKRAKLKREQEILLSDSEDGRNNSKKRTKKRPNRFFNMLTAKPALSDSPGPKREPQETSLQYLRRILRMDVALTAWDFDSTTLTYQLTIIDRDLFLKIPPTELGILMWQQSSKNAPNIGALIAFSHRICNLVATEILRDDSEKIRARLVARFINTADKCNKISNFQSCRSVLCGLQSPPIYRLHTTWTYVRKRHATKYQTFENLCRLYRDPRMPVYQKTFRKVTRNGPYLPFVGDLFVKLLSRIPDRSKFSSESKETNSSSDKNNVEENAMPSILRRLLSNLRMSQAPEFLGITVKTKANGTKELPGGEDLKTQRLHETIEFLEVSQRAASGYIISRNDLAQEYLLKSRYREDRENFLNSFSLESENYINAFIGKRS